MITHIKLIYSAAIKVFAERIYLLLALLMTAFFFGVFIFIPLVTIPGNDLRFQLSIYTRENYVLMSFLAVLVGATFAMQIYAAKKQRMLRKSLPPALHSAALSGASGIFGSIVGTASCSLCLTSLFGFIGFGTGSILFVLQNQIYFLLGAIIAMLVSLYFTARKVVKICQKCQECAMIKI